MCQTHLPSALSPLLVSPHVDGNLTTSTGQSSRVRRACFGCETNDDDKIRLKKRILLQFVHVAEIYPISPFLSSEHSPLQAIIQRTKIASRRSSRQPSENSIQNSSRSFYTGSYTSPSGQYKTGCKEGCTQNDCKSFDLR